MTVATATARSGPYAGNGSTTVFAYTFRVLDVAHLRVVLTSAAGVETVQTLTAQYTVSGVDAAGGGSITMVTAPAAGETLTILRNVPFTQETDYQNQGAYYAETVEDALDLLTMADQQLTEQIGRSVTLPVASSITDLALPTPTAERLIGWDDDGDALINYVPNTAAYVVAELADLTPTEAQQLQNIGDTTISAAQWGYLGAMSAFGATLIDDVDAAAARATLGLVIGTNVQAYNAILANLAGLSLSQGDILYRNASGLVALPPGTAGRFLQTQGPGANPQWDDVPGGWVYEAAQPASGTNIDVNIGAGSTDFDVFFSGVSLSGSGHFLMQLGDSGGIDTSGYASVSSAISSTPASVPDTSGFILFSASSGFLYYGVMSFRKGPGNIWFPIGNVYRSSSTISFPSGRKTLSGEITTIRFTATGGNNYDAGTIFVRYRRAA